MWANISTTIFFFFTVEHFEWISLVLRDMKPLFEHFLMTLVVFASGQQYQAVSLSTTEAQTEMLHSLLNGL